MKKATQETVHACINFRVKILKLTQKQLAEKSEIKLANLCAFENQRANNIMYLYTYFNACTSNKERFLFRQMIFNVIGE